jgi:hypothetical protein
VIYIGKHASLFEDETNPSEVHYVTHTIMWLISKGKLISLPQNNSLGLKWLTMTNTLAYDGT